MRLVHVRKWAPVVLQDGTNTYVYGLDLISATDNFGGQAYFLYDGLGSAVNLTNAGGTVTGTYSYDVFGAIRSQTGGAGNPWLFTGEQRDGFENLYYLRARYYDPATGRFLGRDPLLAGNLYAYVGNNPVNWTDPDGHIPAPPLLGEGKPPPVPSPCPPGGIFTDYDSSHPERKCHSALPVLVFPNPGFHPCDKALFRVTRDTASLLSIGGVIRAGRAGNIFWRFAKGGWHFRNVLDGVSSFAPDFRSVLDKCR